MLLILFSTALAQIGVTSPITNSFWKEGSSVYIQWQYIESASSLGLESLTVELMKGDANEAELVAVIAENVSPETTRLTWTVPEYPDGKSYFVRVQGLKEGNPVFGYSGRFTIKDEQGVSVKQEEPEANGGDKKSGGSGGKKSSSSSSSGGSTGGSSGGSSGGSKSAGNDAATEQSGAMLERVGFALMCVVLVALRL